MGVPYKYKNHLSLCPECGKELKETDYDCPGCGVNLVGYNELQNRANNLKESAEAMEKLSDRNGALNAKILEANRKNQEKENAKKRRAANIKKLAPIIILGSIGVAIAIMLIINIVEAINEKQYVSMTYDEVVEYLENWNGPTETLDDIEDWEVLSTNKKTGDSGEMVVNQGYEHEIDKSYIQAIFKPSNSDIQYSVIHQFDAEILYATDVSLYYTSLSYHDKYFYEESFNKFDGTADEYYLDTHAFDWMDHYVQKLAVCDIGEYEMHIYTEDEPEDGNGDYLYAIVPIDDNYVYELEIHTSSPQYYEELVENYREYVNIRVEKSNG